jgi:hypothetical protein
MLMFPTWRSSALLATAVLLPTVASAADAAGDKPPRWEVVSICSAHTNDALCPRAESDARRGVLDRWSAVPMKNRSECVLKINANANPSWRKFAACLDDLAFRDFERGATTQSAVETSPKL